MYPMLWDIVRVKILELSAFPFLLVAFTHVATSGIDDCMHVYIHYRRVITVKVWDDEDDEWLSVECEKLTGAIVNDIFSDLKRRGVNTFHKALMREDDGTLVRTHIYLEWYMFNFKIHFICLFMFS